MPDNKYVLMKWKDGWKEVVAIDEDAVGFNKYYVIERKEYFGRLVFDRPSGENPGLIVIDRAPMEIEQVAMLDGNVHDWNLSQVSTYKEGDRVEYNYELQKDEARCIKDVKKEIEESLARRGVTAKGILSMSDSDRSGEIKAIAMDARIVASKDQGDLEGFIIQILSRSI